MDMSLLLFFVGVESEIFKRTNRLGLPCCQYYINALYDCLNHTFLDWSIDGATKKQESDALINIIYSGHCPKNAIFTADRGYENYNLFAHFIENNLKFDIRVKDINSKNGIMTNIATPEGTFDINATRILTRFQTKEVKADKGKYAFIPTTSRFDLFGPTLDHYEQLFDLKQKKILTKKLSRILLKMNSPLRISRKYIVTVGMKKLPLKK